VPGKSVGVVTKFTPKSYNFSELYCVIPVKLHPLSIMYNPTMLRTCLFVLTFITLLGSCARRTSQSLIGQWQGQDPSGNAIHITFTEKGEYLLSVNQQPLIGSAENHPLQFSIAAKKKKSLEVHLFEDSASSFHATLQADFLPNGILELIPEPSTTAQQQAIRLQRL